MQLTEGPIGRRLNVSALPVFLGSRLGPTIIRMTFPLYIVYAFLETCGGAIRSAGKALPTMLIILVNMCGVQIGALKEIPHNMGSSLTDDFQPSAACKFLDLPPVGLRNLQATAD